MGIKFLNRFLLDNCNKKSIKKTHLKMFENKTIVIDTSIYLYKFISDEQLIENIYLMLSIFKFYIGYTKNQNMKTILYNFISTINVILDYYVDSRY